MTERSLYSFCPYDGEPLVMDPRQHEGRPGCRRCGFVDYQNPRPCVDVVVFHDDKVLLARRAIEPARGMWDFPGGFSEAGETAEETAVREVLEETSLQVRVTGYLGSLPDVYGDRQLPILSLCFTAEVLGGEPHAQSDVADLAWFGRGDLPEQMAFAHQKQLVRWCKEGRGGLQ